MSLALQLEKMEAVASAAEVGVSGLRAAAELEAANTRARAAESELAQLQAKVREFDQAIASSAAEREVLAANADALRIAKRRLSEEVTQAKRALQRTLEQANRNRGGGDDVLRLPSMWSTVCDPLLAEMVLVGDGVERREVEAAFLRTLAPRSVDVVDVQRVQNASLWRCFAVKRHCMGVREAAAPSLSSSLSSSAAAKSPSATASSSSAGFERRWLFHGTNKEVMPAIVQQGFNRSFCGKNATVYGKGVYFARDAKYSARRCYSIPDADGIQYMLLCRVAVGHYCKGEVNARAPAVRHGHVLYDSTCGLLAPPEVPVVDTLANPSIFVTYHDSQAYPEYLLRFRATT